MTDRDPITWDAHRNSDGDVDIAVSARQPESPQDGDRVRLRTGEIVEEFFYVENEGPHTMHSEPAPASTEEPRHVFVGSRMFALEAAPLATVGFLRAGVRIRGHR